MSAERETMGVDSQERADAEAVMRYLIDGTSIDPEIARRIDERADRITAEIRRVHGIIDDATFQALLNDDEL
jgi:hypothetical protein